MLDVCLDPLNFCSEIIVVDLESQDSTAAVAEAHGAQVLRRPVDPVLERVQLSVLDQLRHQWVLNVDPDEVIPDSWGRHLAGLPAALPDDVGIVLAPMQFFFRGRPLRGTVWGGIRMKRLMFHRERTTIPPYVHSGVSLRPGFRQIEVAPAGDSVISHFWAASWRQLIAKHRMYAPEDASRRCAAGELMSWRLALRTPLVRFRESFFDRRGYLDGSAGLGLSLIWAWYETSVSVKMRVAMTGVRREG